MGSSNDGLPATADANPDEGLEPPQRGFIGRILSAFSPGAASDVMDVAPAPALAATSDAPHILNLRRLRVDDVATPKAEIVAVPMTIGLDELVAVFRESGYSRLPVYKGTMDHPQGFLLFKDLALQQGFGATTRFSLRKLLRPIMFAAPSMPVGALLQKMQKERIHMALVIDEYGGVDGVVTIEDLIETVIGEIEDEHDEDEGVLWKEEKPGVYLVQSMAPLATFEAAIGMDLHDEDEDDDIDTLGGLVFLRTGRVPSVGEVITHESGVEFEIVDADPRRLKAVACAAAAGGCAREMTWGFPGWRKAGFGMLCGMGVALGQAPLGWWPAALVALVLLFIPIHRAADWRAAGWFAWAAGLGHFGISLSWIISPFLVEPETYGWMAPFALVLMAGGLALFWGAAGALSWHCRHRAIGFAVALAGCEALRGVVFTGFPWAMIAHMWVDSAFGQLAAWVGVNGLNLATLLVVGSFLCVRRWVWPFTFVFWIAGWFVGDWHLGAETSASRDVTLRLVQPAIAQSLKWDAEAARANFTQMLEMTAEGTPADLTIWPETAVPYLIDTAPEVGQMIAAASKGKPVIVGYQRVDGAYGWNSLALIAPDGAVAQHYDKAHLVPFGEYIPFGDIAYDWFGLQAFASQLGAAYSAGPGPAVMDLGPEFGTILPLICYEAIFPAFVNAAPARADWILQITNDAWFGTLTGPWQHVAQVRFRAIEQGLPVVRVANTGVTAVYDANGQIVDALGVTYRNGVGPVGELILPFGKMAVLDVPFIPGALPPTVYTRWGEWPFLLLLGGLGLGLVRMRKHKAA